MAIEDRIRSAVHRLKLVIFTGQGCAKRAFDLNDMQQFFTSTVVEEVEAHGVVGLSMHRSNVIKGHLQDVHENGVKCTA